MKLFGTTYSALPGHCDAGNQSSRPLPVDQLSTYLTSSVISRPRPSCIAAAFHIWRTLLPTHMGTPSAWHSSTARPMSLQTLPIGNPKSKLRGNTCLGNLSSVAPFLPLPALITDIITSGSSPPLTPATKASDVIAKAVDDSMLFNSFSNCP